MFIRTISCRALWKWTICSIHFHAGHCTRWPNLA